MQQLIEKLKLTKVVIVTPSMSGTYGLPVLLEENDIDLRGFVAIAPQSTNKYSKQQYQSVTVPVLVMYGERDKTPYKEESVYWMENIPDVTNVMITKAEHAAFVGNPEDFHKEILRFLSTQCQIGEDTETDNGLNEVYDDDDLFGYKGNGEEKEEEYYDDAQSETKAAGKDQNFEKYLEEYFAGDDGAEYYDDTELFFDNKDLKEEEEGNTQDKQGEDEEEEEDEEETENEGVVSKKTKDVEE